MEGFAKKTATIVIEGLKRIRPLFEKLYRRGFNLEISSRLEQTEKSVSPISGKQIVFTGTMTRGSRDDMEKEAKSLGAKVGKSVTGKTNILVTGENVGTTKLNDAQQKGVQILSEADYLSLIAPQPESED
ncbi:MAG: DNA ligase (NAD+) [uncultured bacterium]|nr:MAG: DNA ligase (NAD+) [uncultured bacterium]